MSTVPRRTFDELHAAPALATLPALSACIDAFVVALDVTHPSLLTSPRSPGSERETAALLLHMHLDACQHLLLRYDQLTFELTSWQGPDPDDDESEQEDDIPF